MWNFPSKRTKKEIIRKKSSNEEEEKKNVKQIANKDKSEKSKEVKVD